MRSVSLREVVFFASSGIKLMPVIFSVIVRPSPPATPAYQARNTIGLTVPPSEARQQEV